MPRRLRRESRKAWRRQRPYDGPALSVVMPVYNTRRFLAGALDSVLTQSFTDLEVVLVDDGSTDGSAEVARAYAERDPRVRVVSKTNAGLGAARNTGAANATGEFLTFCDSDDAVLPGAYDAMVGTLRRTGSDFVTAVITRGDETHAVRPGWMARFMDRDRSCLRIADHPWMLLDITAPNKVFRRSFWRRARLRFPEGVRYEDQVPVTRAFMKASSFDVLRRPVYLWRTRLDGTSISQQKASMVDLVDRIRSQKDSVPLFARAARGVRETWYLKLLDYDLPAYLSASLSTPDDYFEVLRGRLEEIRHEAPTHVWERIAFPNRALAWVLSHGHRDAGATLVTWLQRNVNGLPSRVVDERVEYHVPGGLAAAELPAELRRVREVDVRPVVRLTEVRWDDHELVLRGSAFLTPLPDDYSRHELTVTLREHNGTAHEVPVRRFRDPRLGALSVRAFEDHSDTGFEARIDADALSRTAPAGQQALRLEFTHRQGDYTKVSEVTHIVHFESGGDRQPREAAGRMVRLAGVIETGLRVLVHDSYAWSAGSEPAANGLELELLASRKDPVAAVLLADGDTVEELPWTAGPDGQVRVAVQPGTVERVLTTRHRSGLLVPVLWGDDANVLGHEEAGGFVYRGLGQVVTVGPLQPSFVFSSAALGDRSMTVQGVSLGGAGRRLLLAGERARSTESAPLPNGPFEVDVPLTSDPWLLGESALPEGSYRLVSRDPDGPPQDEARHVTTTSLRGQLPPQSGHPGQFLRLGVSGGWNLAVASMPMSEQEGSAYRQQHLIDTVYPAARSQEPLPVVLLESFGGKSTGDSPAAIADELLRRDSSLDLVWSVLDGSVRPPAGTRAVHRFSTEWYELLGRAKYLVNNNNFPYFFAKGERQTYVQTWHGTPLKRIGNDIPDKRYMSVSYMKTMDDEARGWDYLVSPSDYCSEIFPRAFGYAGPVLESGYPRNDILARPEGADRRRDVRRRLGIAPGQRAVLYAPTWRDSARTGLNYSKVLYLEPAELAARQPGTVVLVRGHSNTAGSAAVAGEVGSGVLDVTLYPDINDLYLASDCLVTDYSSVMFDYAVLDRPIMFLVPDLADYRDRLRGFYFDFEAEAPGPLFGDQEELFASLAALPGSAAAYTEARAKFRQRFAPWDDGQAAARVVDAVFPSSQH